MLREVLMRRPWLLAIAHAAGFWPVWSWYLARLDDGSDEPWALAALMAAVALSWPRRGWRLAPADALLGVAVTLTVVYAVITPFAPPLVRAVFAMSALACSWISVSGARARAPALICLLVLSVPVIASLQFYAGFPMRIVTATGATALLNLFGADVARAGTGMVSGGQTVLVDAPCSGVRMLWTATVLCCALAAMRARVSWSALAGALAGVIPIVLAANSVRAALLFLVETRSEAPPDWLHAGIGMLVFLLAAALLLANEVLLERWSRRDPRRAPALSFRAS